MSGAEMSIESQRAAWQESEEHYRAVAEAATDAIITIDSDSTILIVNPAPKGYVCALAVWQIGLLCLTFYLV